MVGVEPKTTCTGITLIGKQVGWRVVFPNEKHELSAGCTEDRRASKARKSVDTMHNFVKMFDILLYF